MIHHLKYFGTYIETIALVILNADYIEVYCICDLILSVSRIHN